MVRFEMVRSAMVRVPTNRTYKIIRLSFFILLCVSILFFYCTHTCEAYYGLGLYGGGIYGGLGLYGLGGLYSSGLFGLSGLYGGIASLYGLSRLYGLYGLSSLLWIGGLIWPGRIVWLRRGIRRDLWHFTFTL